MGTYLGRETPTEGSGSVSAGATASRVLRLEEEARPAEAAQASAPLVCTRCLAPASWSRHVLLCGRCNFPYCTDCMGPLVATRSLRQRTGPKGRRALCPSCRSSLLRLPDSLLRYIMMFLSYRNQDRLLSVCTRFSSVVWVPYDYVKSLEEPLQWREPFDVLHTSPRSVVLRCVVRDSGEVVGVKLMPKNQLVSRRLWQRMQDALDIWIGCNFYKPVAGSAVSAMPACPSPFPQVRRVQHTRDLICVAFDFINPAQYVPLFDALQFGTARGSCSGRRAVWSEKACLRLLLRLLDAVTWLHEVLGVVHRNISLETIHVDLGRGDGMYGLVLTGFSNARFTTPRAKRPRFLQPTAAPAAGGGGVGGRESGVAEGAAVRVGDEPRTVQRQDPLAVNSAFPTAPSGASAPLLPPTRKKPVRPLQFPQLTTGHGLPRSPDVYSRVAKERAAVLASGSAAQRFVKPAYYTQQLFLRLPSVPVTTDTTTVDVATVNETATATQAEAMEDSEDDDPRFLVGTPRAAAGFAAPELLPALAAKSTIPSTGLVAEDMQAWDAFAIGGVWMHLLSAVVRESRREALSSAVQGLPPLASAEDIEAHVSAGSWELLLSLMHVDPRKRWTCEKALRFAQDLLSHA